MKNQAALIDRKRLPATLLAGAAAQHAAVRPLAEHATAEDARDGTRTPHPGHDFSQVPARTESAACTVTPTRCPFGGACHACPVPVQAKLAVNLPGDAYEQEADWIAERISYTGKVQLQRSAAGQAEPTHVPPIVHKVLLSPGQPLGTETRAFMEWRFGRDFSSVRLHNDSTAAESARAVNALAYTVGKDIVFGSRQYTPRTATGAGLLAHELAHVLQQSQDGEQQQAKLEIYKTDDPAEREADRVASDIIAGGVRPLSIPKKPIGVQRAVSTMCIPAFNLFGAGGMPSPDVAASSFGTVAEALIEANYCSVMGCAIMVTDYFDNPIPASYIAFLVAHNPHLNNPADIAALALIGVTGLNRPDILTDRGARKEYYEIKPRSPAGITAGISKLLTIEAFMSAYSLPYVLGVSYTPAPPEILSGTVMAGPWPITVSLRAVRIAPGLIVHDICFTGELAKVAVAALIAALIAVLIALAPELAPVLIPALASADLPLQDDGLDPIQPPAETALA